MGIQFKVRIASGYDADGRCSRDFQVELSTLPPVARRRLQRRHRRDAL